MLRYSKGVRYPRAKISHIKLGASKDWIVLDLKMPGMSGQQLYYRMAESDQKLARRVMFMTGDTVSPDTRDFISASANPAVSKPFSVDEVAIRIEHALARRDLFYRTVTTSRTWSGWWRSVRSNWSGR